MTFLRERPSNVVAGLSGSSSNACVTLCTPDRILGICGQERVTRVRNAGFNPTGLPDEALDVLLRRSGRQRSDITAYAFAESGIAPSGVVAVPLDHHFAHACAAFLPSPFDAATIVVCDHESPQISVWDGDGNTISPIEWPWHGIGFAELFSECARGLGFTTAGREQRMEALARLDSGHREEWATQLFNLDDERLHTASDWQAQIERRVGERERGQQAPTAAALQSRIGELVVAFLSRVKRRVPPRRHLCVGGSLFYNSYFNAEVRLSGAFDQAFVPIDPGNSGLSPGVALYASGLRQPVTPFLGPSYSSEEIKATLDNCKLTYQLVSESDSIAIAVGALRKGHLVAWFDDAMEWGPRALGARSILASPFSPYVLDNLNRFLKHRDVWRGYALSALESAVREHFEGPANSPFMECDYAPKDRARFQHVLPGPRAAVRVHTVAADACPPRFRMLLHEFGGATGLPVVVDTSFNSFLEPIVCSPRDAIRVFFGTGVDMLVLGQFVLTK